MNGSSSSVWPVDSGTKKRFSPTPKASAIFSSVPRLGVICPLSMRERYERETRDFACSWLCVIPRDSRNWRMRWPIFSTVSRFGQSSPDCASRVASCGDGVGMTNVTREGSRRTQRRQLSVFVRYCTSPQTLQRTTSRSISEILSSAFFSPTGHPHRLFRRCGGEERFTRGKAETGATGILLQRTNTSQVFFYKSPDFVESAKILISPAQKSNGTRSSRTLLRIAPRF